MSVQDAPAPPPITAVKEGQPLDEATLKKLWRYALMSSFSYKNETETVKTALKALDPDLLATRDDGLPLLRDLRLLRSQVSLIGDVDTDTEVLVALLATGEVILAWRGTETNAGPSDIVTDIYITPSPITDMVGLSAGAKEDEGVTVHRGFLLAFNGTAVADKDEDDLTHTINTLCQTHNVPLKRITCCGHSLGGALATLAAFWSRRVAFPQVPVVKCSFGSPRVGNPAFHQAYMALVDTTYRFVHNDDIVPTVPPPGPIYKHVDAPVLLFQPAKDKYDAPVPVTAPATEPPPPNSYTALFWRRPWSLFYLSVDDHMMTQYIIALNSALGRPPLPDGYADGTFWDGTEPIPAGQTAVKTVRSTMGFVVHPQDGLVPQHTVQLERDWQPDAPATKAPEQQGRSLDTQPQGDQGAAAVTPRRLLMG